MLIFLSGPARGTTFALADVVSLGRDNANDLCVADVAASRRHCLISQTDAGGYRILDLDSFNGTFVNGILVKEKSLEHGDQIAVGDTLFMFLTHEEDAEMNPHTAELGDEGIAAGSTVQLRRENAVYLNPDALRGAAAPTLARVTRNLGALMRISTVVNSIRDLKSLQQKLLELIFEVVPAERGAIVLTGASVEKVISLFGMSRTGGQQGGVRVSQAICRQVLEDGVAILSNDVRQAEAFDKSQSLAASEVKSLVCVPLTLFENNIGVIYLSTRDPAVSFDEDDLQLMTAVASISAVALDNSLHIEWLESENQRLQDEANIKHNLVGGGERMREVYRFIARVAQTDSTVLIGGESGTGKELAAQALHLNSPRANKAFVAFNCAAFAEPLIESELFGHERGAFANAVTQKRGLLEVAHGGTVFLDEVAELTPAIQAKLLRFLQEREFRRVGGTQTIKVDVRLLAATNKDLTEAVKGGQFRADLYYRLNVVSLVMPPLRERPEDIPILSNYFVVKFNKKHNRLVPGIAPDARRCLLKYDWPGNVRELENTIERAIILGGDDFIRPKDLPEPLTRMSDAVPQVPHFYDALQETKKQLILTAIREANNNYNEAAKMLGIHPNNLHRLVRTLNLRTKLDE